MKISLLLLLYSHAHSFPSIILKSWQSLICSLYINFFSSKQLSKQNPIICDPLRLQFYAHHNVLQIHLNYYMHQSFFPPLLFSCVLHKKGVGGSALGQWWWHSWALPETGGDATGLHQVVQDKVGLSADISVQLAVLHSGEVKIEVGLHGVLWYITVHMLHLSGKGVWASSTVACTFSSISRHQ